MISNKMKEALFWILILTSLVFFLWRLFGNSPEENLIVYPLLIALLVNAWNAKEDTAILKTKFENFERQFSAMAKDFKTHIVEFREVKENLSTLTKEFKSHIKSH